MAAVVLASVSLALAGVEQRLCAPMQQPGSPPDFRQLLQKLAGFSPDPCGPPYGEEAYWQVADVEFHLFQQAADIVTQQLNASPGTRGSAGERAAEALKRLERMSADINAPWPEENRFHFQILDLRPALVIKMAVGTREGFFVFGIPEQAPGKRKGLWQNVGSDEESAERDVLRCRLDLYPLHRGPSENARFLARFYLSGCAGSIGVAYDAREWDPKGVGDLKQIIKQAGAFGMEDHVRGFARIGELRTEGTFMTLPYCWFSPIDTWDNPSLCAVDTYDVSGDNVRFRGHMYNRPDLLPIAKAIEYAEQRDYPAVLGYCASNQVAHKLVQDVPPFVFAGELRVTRTGKGKEHVELGDEPTYGFDVEKHADGWRVVAFSAE
ncbi:MAG TPA: hypothetical protein VG204_17155 [Terriglobia bacterium]|nr:hypothetical protein [Terriglobia bacterium]